MSDLREIWVRVRDDVRLYRAACEKARELMKLETGLAGEIYATLNYRTRDADPQAWAAKLDQALQDGPIKVQRELNALIASEEGRARTYTLWMSAVAQHCFACGASNVVKWNSDGCIAAGQEYKYAEDYSI